MTDTVGPEPPSSVEPTMPSVGACAVSTLGDSAGVWLSLTGFESCRERQSCAPESGA